MKYFIMISAVIFLTGGCAAHKCVVKDNKLHISIKQPDAENVLFYCSLDEFKPHEAVNTGSGKWEMVLPLNREFTYFYMVDEKAFIPECKMKITDDFGSENCVYIPLIGRL